MSLFFFWFFKLSMVLLLVADISFRFPVTFCLYSLDFFFLSFRSKCFVALALVGFVFFGFGLFGIRVFDNSILGLYFESDIIRKAVISKASEVRIQNYGIRLYACVSLYIDCFLYLLFELAGCLVLLFYCNYDVRFEPCPKILNYGKLVWSFVSIKLY